MKNIFRRVSILAVFFKMFEKLLQNQFLVSFDNILSKFQCGFRKGYSTQRCLLMMLEFWKDATDKYKAFGASLTDLSKGFNGLCHFSLNSMLISYLDISSLNSLQDYFSECKQRTKVDSFLVPERYFI